jgi:hypothetical protein
MSSWRSLCLFSRSACACATVSEAPRLEGDQLEALKGLTFRCPLKLTFRVFLDEPEKVEKADMMILRETRHRWAGNRQCVLKVFGRSSTRVRDIEEGGRWRSNWSGEVVSMPTELPHGEVAQISMVRNDVEPPKALIVRRRARKRRSIVVNNDE